MNDLVLMCSKDPDLSAIRTLVLSKIARVRNASNLEDIRPICQNNDVQLAILCHTLSDLEKDAAVDIVRSRCKNASILILNSAYDSRDPSASYQVFDIDEGPGSLLENCKALIVESKTRAMRHTVTS